MSRESRETATRKSLLKFENENEISRSVKHKFCMIDIFRVGCAASMSS